MSILLPIVFFVSGLFSIYGGIRMIVAQGNSEALQGARNTILNAVIGLLITVSAAVVINFIGGTLGA